MTQAKRVSQVNIFYGEDSFSLLKKIDRWKEEFGKKFGTGGIVTIHGGEIGDSELINKLQEVGSPSLFASKKLVICKDCLPKKAGQESLSEMILKLIVDAPADIFFIFYATYKPDKRLGSIKKIFASSANVVEFELPHGPMLNAWIKAYAQQLNVTIDDSAAERLAIFLGRDLGEEKKFGGRVVERKEIFDLWQAHSELLKLSSMSSQITEAHVRSLVIPVVSENVFDLSDTLFKKDKRRAMELLENLFTDQSADEKSTAIKVVGLLTEQVRALLLAVLLKNRNLDNQEIADMLGWSSGRVFMVLKQTAMVNVDKLKHMLGLLLRIDLSLKTSDANAKLLLDEFVYQFS